MQKVEIDNTFVHKELNKMISTNLFVHFVCAIEIFGDRSDRLSPIVVTHNRFDLVEFVVKLLFSNIHPLLTGLKDVAAIRVLGIIK